jgi:hypothetical protein
VANINLPTIDELFVHRAELEQPQLKPRVRLERLARELRACLGPLQRAELSMMFLNATTEEYFCGRSSLGRSERAAAQIIFVANRDQVPLVAKFFNPEASEAVSVTPPEVKPLRIGEGWVLMILCCFMLLCGRGFSQTVPKPHSFDVAVQTWSDRFIDAKTDYAYVVFVEGGPEEGSDGYIKYLRFQMCMNSVRMAKIDPKARPTPEHVKLCDRLIDTLAREEKAQPKW